nr:translation machinery-associated protein 16 [Cryptococcus depauperatus CBS 7841]
MPSNRKLTKKTIKGKEGLHPGSRKAAQLTRVQLRIEKLKSEGKVRKDQKSGIVQRPLFFIYSLSSQNPITLESLKALITEVYLKRHDNRIAELTAERRAGRPKPKELSDLEEEKRRETSEYETGMEVPDLTHAPTSHLIYSWIESDININHARLDLLRHIRVGPNMDTILTKGGNAEKMGLAGVEVKLNEGDDWTTMLEGDNKMEETMQE